MRQRKPRTFVGDIENNEDRISVTVVRGSESPEPLLAGSVGLIELASSGMDSRLMNEIEKRAHNTTLCGPYHGELDLLVAQHHALRLRVHILGSLLIEFSLLRRSGPQKATESKWRMKKNERKRVNERKTYSPSENERGLANVGVAEDDDFVGVGPGHQIS